MDYFQDAKELIEHAKETFEKIKVAYSESINNTEIKKSLLIEIKNFLENLRSSLDYSAHGLFVKYGFSKKTNCKIYFPYATLKNSKVEFQTKRIIERNIPGIEGRPDIVKLIESYQHFENPYNKWLAQFMELNNENKHLKLTPQIKKNLKQLYIGSGGTYVPLAGPDIEIKLPKSMKISYGDATIEGGQTFSAENPPIIKGKGFSVIKSYKAFLFEKNKEEVIPFLANSLSKIEKIVRELSVI